MADAAPTLKHVTLELGGKSPLIVFEDADLDDAVSGALLANFYSAGEVCSNGTRVFVQSVKAKFLDKLVARVERMTIGDPLDPKTQVGALISEEHMNKVLGYIERGRKEGARILVGGKRVKDRRAGARLLRCADGLRRLQRRHGDRARGNLRAGDDGPVVRRTRTRSSPAPTPPNTASPPASSPATWRAPIASSRGWKPAPAGSTTTTSRRSSCPSAASSAPASGARTARRRSSTTRN